MRRTSVFCAAVFLTAGLVSGFAFAQPWTPPIPKGDLTVDLVPVVAAGELTSPIRATHAGDGSGRLFIVDQPGQIRIVDAGGVLLDTPFLDLVATGDVVTVATNFDERGLLGLAFHPNYRKNGRFFVRYSKAREGVEGENCFDTSRGCHESILAEFRVSEDDPDVADPTSQRILFRVDQPEFNHNAGDLNFGPAGEADGDDDDDDDWNHVGLGGGPPPPHAAASRKGRLLYFTLGDGGGGNDGFRTDPPSHGPLGNGQNIQTHLGGILRIDVDGGDPYGIPADNPFAGTPGCDDGCDEIYAYGMRNPYRFSFDRKDGRLFLGDVGQGLYEEVNIVKKGGNYGWVTVEGFHCFNGPDANMPPSNCSGVGPHGKPLLNPIAEYSHEDGLSVIGGFVYRGAQAALQGKYIFGDFSRSFFPGTGRLFWLDADGATSDIFEFNISLPSDPLDKYVFGFGEDEAGEVYVLTSEQLGPNTTDTGAQTGEVFRIAAVNKVAMPGRTQGDGIVENGEDDQGSRRSFSSIDRR